MLLALMRGLFVAAGALSEALREKIAMMQAWLKAHGK